MHPTFVAHVRGQAAAYGDTRSYTYLREVGRELVEEVVTYRELDRDARALAEWLTRRAEADRPVLLLYPPGLEFLRAFLGCLYAGVIAVPAPAPHDARSSRRVLGMVEDAGAGLVLTTAEFREPLAAWLRAGDESGVAVAATDEPLGDPDAWVMPALTAETTAFLQYTSGSTSEPKGVVVSHGNLMHNEAAISEATAADDTSTVASWLPHFHDMGLIGMLLQPLYAGSDLVFMSPMTFLKRPVRLLEAVDRYRAQVTVAPNFAYELLARRVTDAQLAGLDLSSLRAVLNGAEPVRARTLDAVVERLGPAGFAPDVFLPVYGMAEVTLLASAARIGRAPVRLAVDSAALERDRIVPAENGTRLVSCGAAATDLDIRIVDPVTLRTLPDGQVGEIWIGGPSVAQGYWNRPTETREKFAAYTEGVGPYLRTGDLGARHEGELFITGRLKDLIIMNGRNLYPHDIEEAVRDAHPAVADAPGVVLSIDAGDQERLLVVQGVRTAALGELPSAELSARIRALVSRGFDLPAPNVVLVEHRAVHRTTSGKVQRNSMRSAFLDNTVDGVLHEEIEPSVQRLRARALATL
ncbi:Acyl-CoA synthetase (AMP-forming)/AMP-acid ligase II [Nocardia amikacinitolerans]|uniref:Acyl-CoA synthetase (AMP-forming)/AMP-acid ligase II n=1 Tax=Nocardia amikacinitolerans TaxID=756689 RepID=A0A285L7P5_9NOCA|nr:fatty acyl-AMP ligase [Nocardia amikacinitolerans]MCP2296551.1 Acyl-CoA synthetase (AMP-forming)/AMP-acid ligase II [Nocardia amikacinitolerans]SNY80483.1 Acyl-CoA synthetase (AMP-forming)/AMP-acid ligase II [Nocardia amikacinitolerans]